jgi:hypothetical protein
MNVTPQSETGERAHSAHMPLYSRGRARDAGRGPASETYPPSADIPVSGQAPTSAEFRQRAQSSEFSPLIPPTAHTAESALTAQPSNPADENLSATHPNLDVLGLSRPEILVLEEYRPLIANFLGDPSARQAESIAPPTQARRPAIGGRAPIAPVEASAPGHPDEIHIHIGRIEVTAAPAPAPVRIPSRPVRQTQSLSDYLRSRDGGA